MNTGNSIVDKIGKINISGNITPMNWYKTITRESGKPYLEAIAILSDIVYWYKPTEIRDETSGQVIGYKKKFKSDLLQRSYQQLSDMFGISKREATNAVVRLEKLGVLKRVFRTLTINNITTSNVLFLELNPEKLIELTFECEPLETAKQSEEVIAITFKSDTPHFQKGEPPLTEVGRNTEITTKITTENIKESKERKTKKSFSPPTIEEVKEYCKERRNNIDPEQFIAFYTAKGWKIGSSKMTDWKAAVITWEKRDLQNKPQQKQSNLSYTTEEYERMIMSRYLDNDNETPKTQKIKNNFDVDEFEKYLADKYKQ